MLEQCKCVRAKWIRERLGHKRFQMDHTRDVFKKIATLFLSSMMSLMHPDVLATAFFSSCMSLI